MHLTIHLQFLTFKLGIDKIQSQSSVKEGVNKNAAYVLHLFPVAPSPSIEIENLCTK